MYNTIKYFSWGLVVSAFVIIGAHSMEQANNWERLLYGGAGLLSGSVAARFGSRAYNSLNTAYFSPADAFPYVLPTALASGTAGLAGVGSAMLIIKGLHGKKIKDPAKYTIPLTEIGLGTAFFGGIAYSFFKGNGWADSAADIGIKGSLAFISGLLTVHGSHGVYKNVKAGD